MTCSNKHIRLTYFESRVAPLTVINRQIFLPTLFIRPWFSFYCRYYRHNTNFARSLHYLIIFDTCSDYVHIDCAQSKSGSSATAVTITSKFKLSSLSTKLLRYIIGKITPETHIRLISNVKY